MNNDNKTSIEIIDSGDLEYVTGGNDTECGCRGKCGCQDICPCSGGGGDDAV